MVVALIARVRVQRVERARCSDVFSSWPDDVQRAAWVDLGTLGGLGAILSHFRKTLGRLDSTMHGST